jgi:hypothetical protein
MTDKLIKAPETEALLLADWLDEDACDLKTPRRAAAMLRTQHAEIAALKEAAADISQPATNAAAAALAGIQEAGTWCRGARDEIIFTPRSADVKVIDGTRLYSERELFALMSFPSRWAESAAAVKYDTLDGLPPNAVNTKNPIMEFDDDAPAVTVYPALPMDQLWMQLPDQWRKAIDAQMQADSLVFADTHQRPDEPTISANWDQASDGFFVATIRVSGIRSEVHAKADLQRMRDALSAPSQGNRNEPSDQ